MDSLEAYLEEQHQAGSTDSRGEFTVDLAKAREKLEKFQLAEPSFYLLKVFQAAVAAGASRVDIRLGHRCLSLWFGTDETPFSFHQLVDGLHDVLGLAPSPLRHLAVGLNASLVTQPARVSLTCWSQQENQALIIQEDEVSVAAAPSQRPFQASSSNLYVFQLSKATGPPMRSAMAGEHAAVCQRCSFAPVEVFVDSHPLRTRWHPHFQPVWMKDVSRPFYLVERVDLDRQGPIGFAMPARGWYECRSDGWFRKKAAPETHLFLGGDEQAGKWARCRGAYAIPLNLDGPDTIAFVHDGVLLNTCTARSSGVGAVALAPAQGLRLDLSEFQVDDDEARKQAVEAVERIWSEMLASVKPSLGRIRPVPPPLKLSRKVPQEVGTGGAMGLMAGFLVGSHLGGWEGATLGLLGMVAGAWVLRSTQPTRKFRSAVSRHFRQALARHSPGESEQPRP